MPSANPFQWLMIGETPDAWTVRKYRNGKGMDGPAIVLKYRNATAEAVAPYLSIPEFRRIPVPLVLHDGCAGGGRPGRR